MRERTWMLALVMLAALGCSSGGDGAADGSSDAGADATPAPLSCLMIRNCVYLCSPSNPTCPDDCAAGGSEAARAAYDAVVACSLAACPTGDIDCRCDNECYAGGACIDLVDECTQAMQEGFCLMCV